VKLGSLNNPAVCECDGCQYSGACYGGSLNGTDGSMRFCMYEELEKRKRR